ncbi:MAG: hypothetical protein ACRC33_21245 [Gemmataceae bacterium]
MSDLWPADFGTLDVAPPVLILKEQADLITTKSGGKIVGDVRTGKHERGFFHEFSLVAPFLDDYTYRLLVVRHSVELYPVEVAAEVVQQSFKCESPDAFKTALKAIFADAKTKRVVASILAQTDAQLSPVEG